MVTIQDVEFASSLYDRTVTFREICLRHPLGLDISEADVAGEHLQIHLAAVRDGDVVGTVVLKPVTPALVKIRQMAVAPDLQGQGVGRLLVQSAERRAQELGFDEIEMAARKTAQGFYEKLGYRPVGSEFVEVSVPHIKMAKAVRD